MRSFYLLTIFDDMDNPSTTPFAASSDEEAIGHAHEHMAAVGVVFSGISRYMVEALKIGRFSPTLKIFATEAMVRLYDSADIGEVDNFEAEEESPRPIGIPRYLLLPTPLAEQVASERRGIPA
jgi:hypothetical protein